MKHQVTGKIHSIQSIADDLSLLGFKAGMHVIVHSSYRSLGHVIGGPASVILALEKVITLSGTILMPTFTESLCDPSTEENLYPQAYWEQVRAQLPVFDADLTPTTRSIGFIPELFRKQKGVVRSSHPHLSFAAWGRYANEFVSHHSLHFALGEQSPLARLYDRDGYILFLGAPHDANTSLHLAEYRQPEGQKKAKQWDVCLLQNGQRVWTHYEDIENECSDFPQILDDFIKTNGFHRQGQVGEADCQFLSQREMVDFAVGWMSIHRQVGK